MKTNNHTPVWEKDKSIFQQQAYQDIVKKDFSCGNYLQALDKFKALFQAFEGSLSVVDRNILYSRIASCAADAILKQEQSEKNLLMVFEENLKLYLNSSGDALSSSKRMRGSTDEPAKRLHEALELFIQYSKDQLKTKVLEVVNQYGKIDFSGWGFKLALDVLMEKLNKERINFIRRDHLENTRLLSEIYLTISDPLKEEYRYARSAVMNILSDIAYFEKGEENNESLDWVIKSLEINPDNHFAVTRKKFLEERKAVIEQIRRFQHDTAHTKAGIEGLVERCLRLPEAEHDPLNRYLKTIQAEMYHLYGVHRFIHDVEPEYEFIDMEKTIHDLILPFDQQKAFFELRILSKTTHLEVDESYFRLAVYNLLLNAIEAFERKKIPLAKRKIIIAFNADEKSIMIEDNAGGVLPELKNFIFSPYISSKGYKMKTGIGLTNARKAIENIEGRLEFPKDQPDNGARFEIYLT